MQEWVTVIIVLLIVAILLDGVRRMRIAQRDKIRMSRSIYKNQDSKDEPTKEYTSELPNGGARVVGQRDPSEAQSRMAKKPAASANRRAPEQARLNIDESVPLLMESVSDDALMKDSSHENTERLPDHERIEPTLAAERPQAQRYQPDAVSADVNSPAEDHYDEDIASEDDDYYEEAYVEDALEEEDYDEVYDEAASESVAQEADSKEPEEVLIINIMAFKGETFNGADLLDAVLKCGMRYGDMDIFHRYSDTKGEGALLFSMANMVKPGTFDLDAMDQFETPGVSLFMTLPLKADSMQSFDLMVECAHSITEALDGELKDEQRSVLTRQTIEHCRQRVRDFELKRLSRSRH